MVFLGPGSCLAAAGAGCYIKEGVRFSASPLLFPACALCVYVMLGFCLDYQRCIWFSQHLPVGQHLLRGSAVAEVLNAPGSNKSRRGQISHTYSFEASAGNLTFSPEPEGHLFARGIPSSMKRVLRSRAAPCAWVVQAWWPEAWYQRRPCARCNASSRK